MAFASYGMRDTTVQLKGCQTDDRCSSDQFLTSVYLLDFNTIQRNLCPHPSAQWKNNVIENLYVGVCRLDFFLVLTLHLKNRDTLHLSPISTSKIPNYSTDDRIWEFQMPA